MAALSLAIDLGNGYLVEKALRDAVLATGLARQLGLGPEETSDVYYLALLEHLGCTAGSHELAVAFGGDDNGLRRTSLMVDQARPREAMAAYGKLHADRPAALKATILVRSVFWGDRFREQQVAAVCEAGDRLATRLGMSVGVREGLRHAYTRWDGKGSPQVAGERIALSARIVRLAHLAEVFLQLGGPEAAAAEVQRRAGGELDPAVAQTFLKHADALLAPIALESIWDVALAAEPEVRPWLPASRLDSVCEAFADFADLKSTFTLSHSSRVGRLAERAAHSLGLSPEVVADVRRAGLLHDVGRVAVPNGIWEKPGPLTASEWERVRLHAYYGERVLSRSPLLKPIAVLAGMHHERLDGSGYHRGARGTAVPRAARLLAAADAFQAMTEPRAHRAAQSSEAAARELQADADAGRLDREAVEAVLRAAGQTRSRTRAQWPAGLTDREVDVLRLVARGNSEKEAGRILGISTNTVHHHVKQVYSKIQVTTRAGAALFAMEHDLISD